MSVNQEFLSPKSGVHCSMNGIGPNLSLPNLDDLSKSTGLHKSMTSACRHNPKGKET